MNSHLGIATRFNYTLLNFYNQVFQRVSSIQAMELQAKKEDKQNK